MLGVAVLYRVGEDGRAYPASSLSSVVIDGSSQRFFPFPQFRIVAHLVVLCSSVSQPGGRHNRDPGYQIFTLGFVTVAKLQLRSWQLDHFMVGVSTALGRLRHTALKQFWCVI